MKDREQKAFDFAQESTKQLLTLATGVLALTITFRKDIASHGNLCWLEAAWVAYLISAIVGVVTLGALAGHLDRTDTPTIYDRGIRWPSIVQMLTFLIAVLLTIIFAFTAL